MNKWNKIVSSADIDKLPIRIHPSRCSATVLVSSSKKWSLHEVYLMYYDFDDCKFHFPSYSYEWKDIKLSPITEIDRWMKCPRKPKMSMQA